MRVISQNGAIDVPYELTAFHSCNGRICMNMAGDTGRGTEMAVYGSQEKAMAIMRMLHEASYYTEHCIFQFPADDGVMK